MSDELFQIETGNGVVTLLPTGSIGSLRWDEIEDASQGVFDVLTSGSKVVVDMGLMSQCGSAMLALLLRVWKTVSTSDGSLVLCNVSPDIAQVLKNTRLDTLWPVYAGQEEAAAALA